MEISMYLAIYVLWQGIVAYAFTRIQISSSLILPKRRMDTVTENNKITNTGMNIK